jgi:hypothetical protein
VGEGVVSVFGEGAGDVVRMRPFLNYITDSSGHPEKGELDGGGSF